MEARRRAASKRKKMKWTGKRSKSTETDEDEEEPAEEGKRHQRRSHWQLSLLSSFSFSLSDYLYSSVLLI